jgi:hypothetical protein
VIRELDVDVGCIRVEPVPDQFRQGRYGFRTRLPREEIFLNGDRNMLDLADNHRGASRELRRHH